MTGYLNGKTTEDNQLNILHHAWIEIENDRIHWQIHWGVWLNNKKGGKADTMLRWVTNDCDEWRDGRVHRRGTTRWNQKQIKTKALEINSGKSYNAVGSHCQDITEQLFNALMAQGTEGKATLTERFGGLWG